MSTFKKCKIFMLSHSNLGTDITMYHDGKFKNCELSSDVNKLQYHTNQHLYIISDEEIKSEDYFVFITPYLEAVRKCFYFFKDTDDEVFCKDVDGGIYHITYSKKIIASTDTSLNLPKPSPSFIKKFIDEWNKGNKIEDILVEYVDDEMTPEMSSGYTGHRCNTCGKWSYAIVDKQCHCKHIKINPKDNTITIKKLKDSWSKEEVSKHISDFSKEFAFKNNLEFKSSFDFTMNWINNNL